MYQLKKVLKENGKGNYRKVFLEDNVSARRWQMPWRIHGFWVHRISPSHYISCFQILKGNWNQYSNDQTSKLFLEILKETWEIFYQMGWTAEWMLTSMGRQRKTFSTTLYNKICSYFVVYSCH